MEATWWAATGNPGEATGSLGLAYGVNLADDAAPILANHADLVDYPTDEVEMVVYEASTVAAATAGVYVSGYTYEQSYYQPSWNKANNEADPTIADNVKGDRFDTSETAFVLIGDASTGLATDCTEGSGGVAVLGAASLVAGGLVAAAAALI